MKNKLLTLGLALALMTTMVNAASPNKDVAVLYNGASQVNRQTLHYLTQEASRQGSGLNFVPVARGSDIKAGQYRGILVLNTGISTGIDPVLSSFIQSWQDKSQMMLVSLRKGSSDYTVQTYKASPDTLGVDAIAAASEWSRGGMFGGKGTMDMHAQWFKQVVQFFTALGK